MSKPQQLNTEFASIFFADIAGLYPHSERQYDCAGISDIHYCQLGVLRCLSSSVTGQEFLQYHADQNVADIEPGHFFKALKSARRLANITSLNDLLATPMTEHVADPYAQCHELDDWDIYAVDGHYHKAACFDPKHETAGGGTKATATGHFFRMNMRTHHLSCLAMAEPKAGRRARRVTAGPSSTALRRQPPRQRAFQARLAARIPPAQTPARAGGGKPGPPKESRLHLPGMRIANVVRVVYIARSRCRLRALGVSNAVVA